MTDELNKEKGGKFPKISIFTRDPDRDWQRILVATITLIIVTICINAYMFVRVGRGEIFLSDEATSGVEDVLNSSRLRAVVSHYKEKEIVFDTIVSGGTETPVDPSL